MSGEQSISPENAPFEAGTLWTRTIAQTQYALQRGALQSIPVEREFVEQNGIRFLVQTVANLTRKDEAKKQQDAVATASGKPFNPFLPYDPNLFVTALSETHVCLLNKFNVVEGHLLIVTRAYEEQESLLTLLDFQAMWKCLHEIEGLVFYNSGQAAGASQPHKHLQLIPLPLTPEKPAIPIETVLQHATFQDEIGTIPHFPFKHGLIRLPVLTSTTDDASVTLTAYTRLLDALKLRRSGATDLSSQAYPYNLLITREWMLMVPRSQERFESISVNSLGFAGTLLVRNEPQMKILKECGPIVVLKNVAFPPD